MSLPEDVTRLLSKLEEGRGEAWEQLLPIVYEELRRLARHQRLRHKGRETLNTTALVHEAYLKLAHRSGLSAESRIHFFHIAAQAMRDVLVDYARRQRAAKRGGDAPILSFDEKLDLPPVKAAEVLSLDAALTRLEQFDAQQAKLVELRYFVGLTIEETAEMLGSSPSSVKRLWRAARAWLYQELEDS